MERKAAQATPNQLLRRARQERGWTQKLIAERIGAPNDVIVTRWERGTAFPSPHYVERLCQLFGQSASDLGLLKESHTLVAPQPLKTIESNKLRDPLLATRLHPPRPPSRLVSRSHLAERLQQGMEHTLTLISAPAGFGKTTLLAQWLAESETPVAWLSLEPEDNDPVRFLTYLIAALQTVDTHVGTTALDLLRTSHHAPPETVVTLLTNDLLRSTVGDFALVLDDYHVITAEPLHRALTALVEHLPPQLHLLLATRADPPLPLARLRARGQLSEVRAADLRFSSEEAHVFLHTIMGLDLPPGDIAALERRTEGWIAGLQLAALSLQGRADVSSFLAAFTGSHRYVLDYLSEEVLARQPAVVQSFLLHTSILERLSGSLCDAVTGQQGSQAMLEALERANLFVVALDDERRWYRYHHLFAEVLNHHLAQTEPQLVPELHRRASTWYERHDFVAEAVPHALAASDGEQAARLIEQVGHQIALRGQVETVLGWLNILPDTLIRARPRLCLYHADLLRLTSQSEAAEMRLQEAKRGLEQLTSPNQRREIEGAVAALHSIIARSAGDLSRCVALANQAFALFPEEGLDWRALAQVDAAHVFLMNGDVTPLMEQRVMAAIDPAKASGDLALHLRSLTLLAQLHVLQGRLGAAATTYEHTISTDRGSRVADRSHVATAATDEQDPPRRLLRSAAIFFGQSELLYEWNELDQAEVLLAEGMEQVHATSVPFADDVLLGYWTLARLQQARGQFQQAVATLNAFTHLAQERSFADVLVARGAAMRAHMELAQGNLRAALSWLEHSNIPAEENDLIYLHEREYLTLARVRIAQGREDPQGPFLPEALHVLDRLLADAEAKARMRSALEILIVQALAVSALGDRARALTTLERALTLAAPEGYIRLFVDEGEPVQVLLRQILPRVHGSVQGYVAALLSAFDGQLAIPAPDSDSLIVPLTEREREVLRLLLEGASNREIARRLVLSINTVKRHIYNLCGKLGVQSRTQVIVKARALDLS